MPSITQVEIDLNSLSSSSSSETTEEQSIESTVAETPDAVQALLNLARKEKEHPFDNNRHSVFTCLENLALEIQEFESTLAKSKVPNFLSFKAKNKKVISNVCDVAKTAIDAYLAFESISETFRDNKDAGVTIEMVKDKQNAATDAYNALHKTARNLPSQKIMRNTGIAMVALGVALIIGCFVLAGLAVGSAMFVPPVSAILAYCAGASLLSGIGLFAGGTGMAINQNKNTGMPSLLALDERLSVQNLCIETANKRYTPVTKK